MLNAFKNASHSLAVLVRGGDDFSTSGKRDKTRDYAVLGGAAGFVAGAAIGTIKGFDHQSDNSVKETWVDKKIVVEELKGYHHGTQVDRDRYCVERDGGRCVDYDSKTKGWWHNYSPNIEERVVGTYKAPEFHNSHALEPLGGALLGGLAGGVVGVAAGLGVAALARALDDEDSETKPVVPDPKETGSETKATGDGLGDSFESWKRPAQEKKPPLLNLSSSDSRLGVYAVAGTALGTGVGIYLGVQAGAAEQAANQVNSRTWSVPVYEHKTIGQIPDSYYEHKHFLQLSPENGSGRPNVVPVDGKVPVTNPDGTISMEETHRSFHSQRYNKVLGGLAGGAIGAGVGLAAGVSVGIADRLLTEAITKS